MKIQLNKFVEKDAEKGLEKNVEKVAEKDFEKKHLLFNMDPANEMANMVVLEFSSFLLSFGILFPIISLIAIHCTLYYYTFLYLIFSFLLCICVLCICLKFTNIQLLCYYIMHLLH